MGKLRLMFTKEGRAVYLSHLDLMRSFQRAFLRAGVALRHSQGYHPHPILSIVLPLSVGQSSVCELMDFEAEGDRQWAALPLELNRFLPEGIRALGCYEAVRPVRELERLHSQVELTYDGGVPVGGAERVRALLTGESVCVRKRTKRKALADIDLRPMLHELEVVETPGMLTLEAVVSAQNPGMNPALLAAAVEAHLPELAADFTQVRRVEVLDREGRPFR